MIVVRDVFSLKFGKAREVKALMEESKKIINPEQLKNSRLLFDLVGPAYTMVLESTHSSLADFEASMQKVFNQSEWRGWYERFTPLIEKSYREIFTIVQ